MGAPFLNNDAPRIRENEIERERERLRIRKTQREDIVRIGSVWVIVVLVPDRLYSVYISCQNWHRHQRRVYKEGPKKVCVGGGELQGCTKTEQRGVSEDVSKVGMGITL